MRRKLIYYRISPFTPGRCHLVVLCGISSRFQLLSPCNSQIVHALLTRPPLTNCQHKSNFCLLSLVLITKMSLERIVFNSLSFKCFCYISKRIENNSQTHLKTSYFCANNLFVRLACFKHAASVRPEPGSNSNVKLGQTPTPFSRTRLRLTAIPLVSLPIPLPCL